MGLAHPFGVGVADDAGNSAHLSQVVRLEKSVRRRTAVDILR